MEVSLRNKPGVPIVCIQEPILDCRCAVRGTPKIEYKASRSLPSVVVCSVATEFPHCDDALASFRGSARLKALTVGGALCVASDAATLLALEARVRAISTNSSLS